jgi:hypothetical protein
MSERKRVVVNGREVQATPLEFRPVSEPWAEYMVEDGSKIRVRTIAAEILRIDGETDADGNPLYIVRSGNVMSVAAPDSLLKEKT